MPVTCLRVSEYSSAEERKGLSEMKSLLFALGLALCCFVQASQDQQFEDMDPNMDHSRYMGRWVNIALACNSTEDLEHLKHIPAFVAYVSRPKEDVFSVSVLIPMPDGCKNITCQFGKGEDGKHSCFRDDTKVTVESVKILDEAIMSTITIDNKERITALHSRTVTPDPKIHQKFKEGCIQLGYSEDQIVVLKPTVMCP